MDNARREIMCNPNINDAGVVRLLNKHHRLYSLEKVRLMFESWTVKEIIQRGVDNRTSISCGLHDLWLPLPSLY